MNANGIDIRLEEKSMLLSEEFNDASPRQHEPSMGLVFFLASSLLQGGGLLPGSPMDVKAQSAEAATIDGSAAPTKNKRAQGTAPRRANSRETSNKKVIRGQASWYG